MAVATHEDFSRKEAVKGSSDRSFGLVFTAFFGIYGLWPLWKGGAPRLWSLALSGAFLALALIAPAVLHPLNLLWTKLGLLLARITNPIVTGLMFYVIFTPAALAMRLMGKDLLRLRPDPDADSYWIPRQPPGPPPETMRNQF
ncbi:MAG: hypothetical protein HY013_10570 [Candidatus Solibacter usitatus]|nr:hypothetical protein [Candidatus Solibacter usitatus]